MNNKKLKLEPGVITGEDVKMVFDYANEHTFALPAVNVIGTNMINAVLETSRAVNSPAIIQFSNGGAHFFGGMGLSNDDQAGAIAGAISGALHIHNVSEYYGVPVMVHTDHAYRKIMPWIDGLLDAGEDFFEAANGFGHRDLAAFMAGEDLGHAEGLAQEALNLAGAEDGEFVLR